MNQPTPDPSQEGSRRSSAAGRFPSWEGLGVGSWSQCMRKKRKEAFHELPPLPPTRRHPRRGGGGGWGGGAARKFMVRMHAKNEGDFP